MKETGGGAITHLGFSGSYMFAAGDGVQFQTRPESYLAPDLVDTGTLAEDRAMVGGVEFAWQKNNLLIQSEWLGAYAGDDLNNDYLFHGA